MTRAKTARSFGNTLCEDPGHRHTYRGSNQSGGVLGTHERCGEKRVGLPWTQHDIGLGHFEYAIPTGVLYPTEVTGVAEVGDAKGSGAQGDGGEARVEFRWEWRPDSSSDLFGTPSQYPKTSGPGAA